MNNNLLTTAELDQLIARFGIRPTPSSDTREWNLSSLAGRFVELSSAEETASLTAAMSLVCESQLRGEPAAWIAVGDSIFFPPDAADSGVDLTALPVVRTPDTKTAVRAADRLLRSRGFGLITLDLGPKSAMRVSVQTRLAGLARKHHTALLCLTRKGHHTASIGSLVSIRGRTRVKKTGFNKFTWEIEILKDKRLGPGWFHAGVCCGPDGLC